MRRTLARSALVFSLFVLLSAQSGLTPQEKEWLQLVEPIITRMEREVFLSLPTKDDRDRFIQVFWKRRDPIPETAENEFQKEYFERAAFADLNFRDGTGRKGSLSERGYFHLLLGPPLERSQYTTHSNLWPLELWFYQGEARFGLPAHFYLIFYQPEGLGAFRLYSPGLEGPDKLVVTQTMGRALTRPAAVQSIRQVSSELADAAQSYIPGERSMGMTSLASETLIASLRSIPQKKFSDEYARHYRDYKDRVETEYSHNFVGSSFRAQVFEHGGQPFLHWTVEPDTIGFAQYDDKVYAVYEVVTRIESMDGRTLHERTEEIPLQLTPEQYKTHERRHLAFQDVLPVIPGRWKFFALLKNRTSKDFTSFELIFEVAPPSNRTSASSLVLYAGREPDASPTARFLKAFTLGGGHYAFNARSEFPAGSKMGAFVQAVRPPDDDPAAVCLFEIRPADGEKAVFSRTFALADVRPSGTDLIDTGLLDLAAIPPGYYRAVLSVMDGAGRSILSQGDDFVMTAASGPGLPWVISRQRPSFPAAEHLVLIGSQAFMIEDYAGAKSAAERALALGDDPSARLLLGKALFALGELEASLTQAEAVYVKLSWREAGKLAALVRFRLGRWADAASLCEDLLREGTEIPLLNTAAEAYLNANQPEKALPLARKSLELEPGQTEMKALLERILKKLGAP